MEAVYVETPVKKAKKRKFSKLVVVLTVFLQLGLSGIVCLGLIVYGPFGNVRNYLIGTAMNTYTHQWIAKMLFSEQQIEAVTQKKNVVTPKQDLSTVTVQDKDSNALEVDEISNKNYHGYVIVVSNPLRIHVAMTGKPKVVGERTSVLAERNNAIAAVNGGGFDQPTNLTGTGAYPSDYVISGGKTIYKSDSLIESDLTYVVALNSKGQLIVGKYSYKGLLKLGDIQEAVTFNQLAPIITNGKATFSDDAGQGQQARTVIAQKADGTILLMVLDGRHVGMPGATVKDCEDILIKQYNAVTAALLDGGSSSTMYYNGNVINDPCGAYGERTVPTALYVEK